MVPEVAAAPSLDRILARPGGLHDSAADATFTPRGTNYVQLSQHSTLEPGTCTSAHAQAVLDNMTTSSGCSTVRVFIDPGQLITPPHGISTSADSTVPINAACIASLADFIQLAAADGIYAIPVLDNEAPFEASQAPLSTEPGTLTSLDAVALLRQQRGGQDSLQRADHVLLDDLQGSMDYRVPGRAGVDLWTCRHYRHPPVPGNAATLNLATASNSIAYTPSPGRQARLPVRPGPPPAAPRRRPRPPGARAARAGAAGFPAAPPAPRTG
jgi:hypothetical protein